jgi:hypothetical protein
MKREELIKAVNDAGDAVITYRSAQSNKRKYNVCTLDFDTPYIQNKTDRVEEDANRVKLFCWDTDSFRLLNPTKVISVVPMANVLKNERT